MKKHALRYNMVSELTPELALLYAIFFTENEGFPCRDCKLESYCAKTGNECSDFKEYVSKKGGKYGDD